MLTDARLMELLDGCAVTESEMRALVNAHRVARAADDAAWNRWDAPSMTALAAALREWRRTDGNHNGKPAARTKLSRAGIRAKMAAPRAGN